MLCAHNVDALEEGVRAGQRERDQMRSDSTPGPATDHAETATGLLKSIPCPPPCTPSGALSRGHTCIAASVRRGLRGLRWPFHLGKQELRVRTKDLPESLICSLWEPGPGSNGIMSGLPEDHPAPQRVGGTLHVLAPRPAGACKSSRLWDSDLAGRG